MKYVAPISGLKAFTCPHCGVLAEQSHHLGIDRKWFAYDPAHIEFNELADDFVIVVYVLYL